MRRNLLVAKAFVLATLDTIPEAVYTVRLIFTTYYRVRRLDLLGRAPKR